MTCQMTSIDVLLDTIYQETRHLLSSGQFDKVRVSLQEHESLPISALLALLTITQRHRDHFLVEREAIARDIERRAPNRAKRLLGNLWP